MPALGGDARRLQPGRAAADHDHLAARRRGTLDDLRQDFLAARGRIVQARDLLPHAIGGADAGPDAFLLAAHDLVDDMRIGHVRARHRHHVEQAVANGVAGRGDVLDARGVKHRQRHLALEASDNG